MVQNTWPGGNPGGNRYAMTQSEHEHWNKNHYPGTRQLCSECGEPTERCEDDTIWSDYTGEPLCEECSTIKVITKNSGRTIYQRGNDDTI